MCPLFSLAQSFTLRQESLLDTGNRTIRHIMENDGSSLPVLFVSSEDRAVRQMTQTQQWHNPFMAAAWFGHLVKNEEPGACLILFNPRQKQYLHNYQARLKNSDSAWHYLMVHEMAHCMEARKFKPHANAEYSERLADLVAAQWMKKNHPESLVELYGILNEAQWKAHRNGVIMHTFLQQETPGKTLDDMMDKAKKFLGSPFMEKGP